MLDFQLVGGKIIVVATVDDKESILTAKLINKVFNYAIEDSGMASIDSENLRHELQKTMNVLYDSLLLYVEDGSENELLKASIIEMIDKKAKFAGFTRAYVRRNNDSFPEFNELL